MTRIPKAVVVCLAIAAILAFFFLAPVIPKTVDTFRLYEEHGWCFAGDVTNPPQTSKTYTSLSYDLFQSGEAYIPSSGYLWWLSSSATYPGCF
jgi:hypothetical protein